MIRDDLTEHELRLLRGMCALEKTDGAWGAWVTAALEGLHARGFVSVAQYNGGLRYAPTKAGMERAKGGER